MKKMNFTEYQDRLQAVNRAMKLFKHMTDGDIEKSFRAYQLLIADQDRKIFINSVVEGNKPQSWLDDEEHFKRPNCPECGKPLFLRSFECGKGVKSNGNTHGWATYLTHEDKYNQETGEFEEECCYVQYSEKSMGEWMAELVIKPEGKQCQ